MIAANKYIIPDCIQFKKQIRNIAIGTKYPISYYCLCQIIANNIRNFLIILDCVNKLLIRKFVYSIFVTYGFAEFIPQIFIFDCTLISS